jgi:hypothetical protein
MPQPISSKSAPWTPGWSDRWVSFFSSLLFFLNSLPQKRAALFFLKELMDRRVAVWAELYTLEVPHETSELSYSEAC